MCVVSQEGSLFFSYAVVHYDIRLSVYITRIDKGASYRKTLTDKFKRLGIPYLFLRYSHFSQSICRGSREAGHLIVEILCQCLCSAIRGPVARDVVRGSCPALLFLVGSV